MTTSPLNDATVAFHIDGRWERAGVSRHGDGLALMVTVSTRPTGAAPERLPIDLALVLDRSGSMAGEKLELVKQATLEAVEHLGIDDTVSVVMFETAVQELLLPSPVTPETHARLAACLREVLPGGSTNLQGGWLTGCEHLAGLMAWEETPHLHRAVVLTDGLANVGVTDPLALTTQAGALRERGITTSTMGVGYGFNEVLLSGMAEAGGGSFAYISHPDELAAYFRREVGDLLGVAVPQPRLHVTFPPGLRATLVNPFPVERAGSRITVNLRDMGASDTVTLVFDVSVAPGESRGDGLEPLARIEAAQLPGADPVTTVRFSPLRRVNGREVARFMPDEQVQVEAARLRVDRDHREALRLDREGRVDDARVIFSQAMRTLATAPSTPEILAEREEARVLLESAGRIGENARKARVHRAMRRSRGQADT